SAGDDATVRVYVHRLRKRLEDFYATQGDGFGGARLVLPAGTYALKLVSPDAAGDAPAAQSFKPSRPWLWVVAFAAVIAIAFAAARSFASGGDAPPVNSFWKPFLDSDRPIVVVVGDYYMFGEIDPVRPELSRLIRDYRVDSPTDLAAMQEADPARYGQAE